MNNDFQAVLHKKRFWRKALALDFFYAGTSFVLALQSNIKASPEIMYETASEIQMQPITKQNAAAGKVLWFHTWMLMSFAIVMLAAI